MSDKDWEAFPIARTVGKTFQLFGHFHNTYGSIASVVVDPREGVANFYAKGDPLRPITSCATADDCWERGSDNAITVRTATAGTLIIKPF